MDDENELALGELDLEVELGDDEPDLDTTLESLEGEEAEDEKPWLRKLAPLGFLDYGRAKIKDSVVGEKEVQEMCSLGLGLIFELGDDFRGAMYYGWPTRPTDETKEDEGRFSFSFIWRF